MTFKNPDTLTQKGHAEVGQSRESKPVKIYYEIHGNGSQLVMLVMGLALACGAWDYQTKYLAGTGQYSVLVFDNRGVGHSDAPIGLYSTSQMAQDALELLDHVGWHDRVHLVGISMGGMISLEMVDADPFRFISLTLTSTTARRNIPTWAAVSALSRIAFIYRDPKDQLNAAIDLVYPPEWLEQKPANSTKYATNRELASSLLIRRMRETRRQPLHGYLAQLAACFRHSVSDSRLVNIKHGGLPVMIITGTFDNLVRPAYSYHMKKILDPVRFELFEGSGHGIPEEQPERYNRLLVEHFNNHPSFKSDFAVRVQPAAHDDLDDLHYAQLC